MGSVLGLALLLRSQLLGLRCLWGAPQVVQQINHAGEVNRARVMPQNQFMIATKTISVRPSPTRPCSSVCSGCPVRRKVTCAAR